MDAMSLKRWKDALIADRDDLLIRAARRWFGPVRTPFNKHELLAKVETYLRKPATHEAVFALMDDVDRLAVASVALAGTMHQNELARIVGSAIKTSPDRRVENLLDRLILYRHDGRGRDSLLSVAPPLKALEKRLGIEQLLRGASIEAEGTEPGTDPWAVYCALVSVAMHVKPAFKLNYEYTKKAAAQLEKTAPEVLNRAYDSTFYLLSLAGARALLPSESGRFMVDPQRFLELSRVLESRYGAAVPIALACSHPEMYSGTVDADMRARFLIWLLGELPVGLCMEVGAMENLLTVMAAIYFRGNEAIAMRLRSVVSLPVLSEMGCIRFSPDGKKLQVSGQGKRMLQHSNGSAGGIVLEESHELRVLPQAGFYARAFAAVASRLEHTGLTWTGILDREAAQAAYAHGMSADELMQGLQTLSGKQLPQSVSFSLREWEQRSRGARLVQGMVVKLDEQNTAIMEHLPHMMAMVAEKLAAGVYLLKPIALKDVEKAFKTSGIKLDAPDRADLDRLDAIPPAWTDDEMAVCAPQAEHAPHGELAQHTPHVPTGASLFPAGQLEALVRSAHSAADEAIADNTVRHLLYELGQLDMSDSVKETLSDTVRSRLILEPSQLALADVASDGASAGALDYSGKVRILERAVREKLAVSLISKTGGTRSVCQGEPQSLVKTPEGLALSLLTNRGKSVILMVSAIERLRIIHSDMFGGS